MHKLKGMFDRGYLPHYDFDHLYQFITYRLYDSVPKDVIASWKDELINNDKLTDIERRIVLERKIHKYEDAGHGCCYLRLPKVNQIVEENLLFHNGKKYDMIEYKIMPNHVHVLIRVIENKSLSTIVHSWKSYTSKEINKLLNRSGQVWMREYYDRYIRNQQHFAKVIEYIRNN